MVIKKPLKAYKYVNKNNYQFKDLKLYMVRTDMKLTTTTTTTKEGKKDKLQLTK